MVETMTWGDVSENFKAASKFYATDLVIFDDYVGLAVSPPEVIDFLPEACRLAGKTIANQPELWCQLTWHRHHHGVRQGCALGQIEDVLVTRFGQPGATWPNKVDKASRAVGGQNIAAVNDADGATPQTVADHLFAVADQLEFGDAADPPQRHPAAHPPAPDRPDPQPTRS